MPFELHVWGPAFGLPSIDAECLAAITYLHHCLKEGEWILIASSDPSTLKAGTELVGYARKLFPILIHVSTDELPTLKDGTIFISRFRNIVDYLRSQNPAEWDLDNVLNKLQKADSIA